MQNACMPAGQPVIVLDASAAVDWELRVVRTAYDAAYVALAEALDAPLVTTDDRLARSYRHRATILAP